MDNHNRLFAKVDRNGDGRIDREEFVTFMYNHLPMDPAALRTELEELLGAARHLYQHRIEKRGRLWENPDSYVEKEDDAKARLAKLFQEMDVTGDGVMSKSELFQMRQMRRELGLAEHEVTVDEHEWLFNKLDGNSDGTIDVHEFSTFFWNRLPLETSAQSKWFTEQFAAAKAVRERRREKMQQISMAPHEFEEAKTRSKQRLHQLYMQMRKPGCDYVGLEQINKLCKARSARGVRSSADGSSLFSAMDVDNDSQINEFEFVNYLWNHLPMVAEAREKAIDDLGDAVLDM